VSAPAPAAAGPGRGIKPLVSLLAHKRAALAVAAAVWMAGVPAVLLGVKPSYRAESAVYISSRFVKNLSGDQELELQSYTMYRDFVQQQARTINRFEVVQTAIESLGTRARLWQRPGETVRRAAERLQGALEIKPVTGTYLITVGLEARSPEGLAEVVNAVVEAYVTASRGESVYASDQRVATLKRRRAELTGEIGQKVTARNELANELGTTNFDETKQNPFDRLLLDAEAALADAKRRRLAADEHLASVDPATERGAAALHAAAADAGQREQSLGALRGRLSDRRTELVSGLNGLTAEHPARRAMEAELAQLEGELGRSEASSLKTLGDQLLVQRRAEAAEAERIEARLSSDLAERRTHAEAYARRASEASVLSSDIQRARDQLREINNRIDFFLVEAEAPGFVRVVSPARPPDVPSGGNKRNLLGAILALGLAAGLAVPVGLDLVARGLAAPNDLERLLGFAPSGFLVDRSQPGSEALSRDLVLRLAATLDREQRSDGQRHFTFTAASPGAGTSTLVLELAAALDTLGVRTLAIEANAFHPDARFAPGEPGRPGLAEVLAGGTALDGAVTPAAGGLPDRLFVGPSPDLHVARLDQLGEVLAAADARYRVVLLDAPPVLLSADVGRIALAGTAFLLVVEALGPPPGQVRRAAREIERLAPPLFGAVLNRVRVFSGGGYFADLAEEHRARGRAPRLAWTERLRARWRRRAAP
jgi:polysaccharide biosynthesis transport protein